MTVVGSNDDVLGLGGFAGGPSSTAAASSAVDIPFTGSASDDLGGAAGAASSAIPYVGAALKVLTSLLKAHDARLKGAKTENAVVENALPIQRQNLQAILNAVMAGAMTPSQGVQAVMQVEAAFWASLPPIGPGVQGARSRAQCAQIPNADYPGWTGSSPCDKTSTVGACIGCDFVVNPSNKTIGLLLGKLTSPQTLAAIPGNKYGLPAFPAVTLTYTGPGAGSGILAPLTGGLVNGANGIATALGFKSPIAGISAGTVLLIGVAVIGLVLWERNK